MWVTNKIRGLKEIWQFENRWYLALTRTLFSKESVSIYRYKGLEILIDHSAGDANGAREVLTSEMYRQFLPQIGKERKINVLDLGANNGGFPLLLKSEGFFIKKVVSVELNPNTFSRLNFNLERNFREEAIPLNCAVCGTRRPITINLGSGGASDNIYLETNAVASKSYKIEGLTFDDIYAENFGSEKVDICKIDIEGAEFEVLRDGNCKNLKNCQYLLMEIHHEKERNRAEVLEMLKTIGFREIDGESKIDEKHYVHFFINENL